MSREARPDDPVLTVASRLEGWRALNPGVHGLLWLARWGERPAGYATARINRNADTAEGQVMRAFLGIHPAFRRRGGGRALLGALTETAEEFGRGKLMGTTSDAVPEGAAFVRAVGARAVLEDRTEQLDLRSLDLPALQARLAQAPREGFTLGVWDGAYPEDHLAEIAELLNIETPRGNHPVARHHLTPQKLRALDQALAPRGTRRWTFYVRERRSGRLVGFTRITWQPQRPKWLNQGKTAVLPAYRRQGLGRWLKVTLLEKVRAELPQAQVIETSTATSNVPMLNLNRELGFRLSHSSTEWALEVARVR
nr:GNAT family N-acetyltransferase [Deinococcus budaensis]